MRDEFIIADIADDESIAWMIRVVDIVGIGCVVHAVDVDDIPMWELFEGIVDEVAADEAAAACDENGDGFHIIMKNENHSGNWTQWIG